jgi:hypothetical protein
MGVGIQPLVIPVIIDHSTASSVFQVHMIHPDYLLASPHCPFSFWTRGVKWKDVQRAHRHMSEFQMISLGIPYIPN